MHECSFNGVYFPAHKILDPNKDKLQTWKKVPADNESRADFNLANTPVFISLSRSVSMHLVNYVIIVKEQVTRKLLCMLRGGLYTVFRNHFTSDDMFICKYFLFFGTNLQRTFFNARKLKFCLFFSFVFNFALRKKPHT